MDTGNQAEQEPRLIPDSLPDADKERLTRIFQLSDEMAGLSYYEILGASRSLNAKSIRNLFRKLARDFHVDRFSRYSLNKATMGTIQKVFIALNRAHETLTDPQERREYDLTLEFQRQNAARVTAGDSTADDLLQDALRAEKMVRSAIGILSRGDAATALERLKEALAITPDDPLGRAAAAYAQYLVGKSQGDSGSNARRALDALRAITVNSSQFAEPFLYLGRVHRDQDEIAEAVEAFTRAIQVNPHFTEAASELRFAYKKLKEPEGGKGFFGRKK